MRTYHYKMEDALEAIIDYRGKTPKKAETGIPTLSAKSVKNGYIDYAECYYISPEEYERFMVRGTPRVGDILLTTEAPMGVVARLDRDDVGIAQRLLTLRGKKGILNNDYLMYYLQSPIGQHKLSERETGSTVTGIKQAEFRKIEIDIPSYEEQEKIVSLLIDFDTKINLNKRANTLLYANIKSLMALWFDEYAPFNGIQPDDWKEMPLSDLATFIGGYSYKGAELQESTTAMATIKNFDRNGGFKLDGYKEIVPSDKLKSTQHVEIFDTLVAHTDLTQGAEVIGNAELVLSKSGYEDIVFSMDVVKVLPKDNKITKFVLGALLSGPKFKGHCLGYVNGTTVLHLSKKALPEYRLIYPTNPSVLEPLNSCLENLYRLIASNIEGNIRLQALKDTFLPKLLSGEIDVSEVEF